jgi:hypothetical protein
MDALEYLIIRFKEGRPQGREGFTLGQLFHKGNPDPICSTLEDEDRRLEKGNDKVPGRTAMPLGRYELELYDSPKHGTVPLFLKVPGFTYTEIHGANCAEQLLGCVAVGMNPTADGVRDCAPAVAMLVTEMRRAAATGQKVFCTIERTGE